jgi:D-glycero-alpha-D-manno-heptose-7-phosphate kinase
MIISRSPLRISLGGGGTDLPSYYEKHGGFLIAGAINKYVYVTVNRPFTEGVFLKYSKLESHRKIEDIEHPIIRVALEKFQFNTPQIEISTIADIPSGTGLGSSGSFTTALLKAVFAHRKIPIHATDLANLACEIEIDLLDEPIGKQDQFISAYGGIAAFTFERNGSVIVEPLKLNQNTILDLEDNLLLFYTRQSRSASKILSHQKTKSIASDKQMIENLHFTKEIGLNSRVALESGNLQDFAKLMDEHWKYKKLRSPGMSSNGIDKWYELGIKNGAIGGKIVGAGGGGFLMFYANDRIHLRETMKREGLEELRFGFEYDGTRIVLS